jgi:hypothetical protein
MRRLPRLSRVLAVVLLCSLHASGCGDDDDGGNAGGGAGNGSDAGGISGNGGSGGGGLPRRDASVPSEGEEGYPCNEAQPCNADLVCAATPFAINGRPVGVCGVPCDAVTDCNDGDQCITYSGAATDAHCVNTIDTQYELCGVADTSVCSEELTCLYFPDFPLGVCVSLCNTGGGDSDAGTSSATMCSDAQMCIEGVLADPEPGEGVCGTLVGRGDECGLEMGRYCGDGDVCGPQDPNDDMSAQRCYQDCSQAGSTCPSGTTCTIVENRIAYCL